MLKDEWQKKRGLVEDALSETLSGFRFLNATLHESMKYSLLAGGKRLRPVLLMASAEAVGARGEDFLPAACAIEMIHTYSLVHDDLPVMDNDDYRRGKPTNHKVYGPGMATLAGDALLTLAFEVISSQKNVEPQTLISVIREISAAAGQSGMVGGQAMDLEAEGKKIDRETLRAMHMGKTGALFRASVRAGALLAGALSNELDALTKYAEGFGLAFQITDDVLDVTGDAAAIGKPVGSDARNEKSTYVTLASIDEAKKLASDAVHDAVDALSPLGERAGFLRELAEYLLYRTR